MKFVKSAALLWGLSLLLLQSPAWAEPVELSAVDVNGGKQRLSDYRGKWVLVNYWATWCMPCIKELPELEAFHNKYKETKAVVLGMNMESIEPDRLRAFLKERSVTYPNIQVEVSMETPFGSVFGMPTSFLINPKGEIAARESGMLSAKLIEDYIEQSEEKE